MDRLKSLTQSSIQLRYSRAGIPTVDALDEMEALIDEVISLIDELMEDERWIG
jgi:hypothetical protein